MTPAEHGRSDRFPRQTLDAELAQRLAVRVERCQARAGELAATLEAEARQLIDRDLNGFDELLRRKGAQVEALEEAEQQLRRVLTEAGYPTGTAGVRAVLRTAPESLRSAWGELEQLLRTIQARNEANGRLIHRNLDHTRRLLDLATGAHERADELTYGTHGGYTASDRSRRITRA
ncbi:MULTISPECIES: flagella synthesis protein FlgN [unclassified Halorhodospira]|uniref:flagella synthesis protein FlgN n=1 Tax=unclassified Halorhodospira TaxID=2626748 RepID=UPI001EE7D827|nr:MULTISPECIES: flagellar protein FlgN [unclassified Halorhodospira]MCG5541132.1 flagellar protein FlgN [Halorhodospira sp. M39old]MCG5545585.1 flagellar protein FlgN [Halorhodospira sp. M38]